MPRDTDRPIVRQMRTSEVRMPRDADRPIVRQMRTSEVRMPREADRAKATCSRPAARRIFEKFRNDSEEWPKTLYEPDEPQKIAAHELTEKKMNAKTFVALTGIVALLPFATIIAAFSLPVELINLIRFLLVAIPLAVGTTFTVHAFARTSLSTESKVMWAVAMFLFFPFVSQFVYWARNIFYAEYLHARFQETLG